MSAAQQAPSPPTSSAASTTNLGGTHYNKNEHFFWHSPLPPPSPGRVSPVRRKRSTREISALLSDVTPATSQAKISSNNAIGSTIVLTSQLRRLWMTTASAAATATSRLDSVATTAAATTPQAPPETWLFLGLPEAGATSLIYRLKLHDFIATARTNATIYESFKLRFTCMRHKFTHGGLPPLRTAEEVRGFQNCQMVEKRIRTADVGRFTRYIKRHSGISLGFFPGRNSGRASARNVMNFMSKGSQGYMSSASMNVFPQSCFHGPGACSCTSPVSPPACSSSTRPPSPQSLPTRVAPALADGLALAARRHLASANALIILIDGSKLNPCTLEFWKAQLRWLVVDVPRVAVVVTKSDLKDSVCLTGEDLDLPATEENRRWQIFHVSSKTGAGVTQMSGWLLFPAECVVTTTDEERERRFAVLNSPTPLLPVLAQVEEKMPRIHVEEDDEDDEDEQPWKNTCRFLLIPNGFDLDRFNFELAEAARLTTGIWASSTAASVRRASSSSGDNPSLFLPSTPYATSSSRPSSQVQLRTLRSATPPTIYGKTQDVGEDLL